MYEKIWLTDVKLPLGRIQELEHKTANIELTLHNELFTLKHKLGLIDHSAGCYGLRGHRGPRGFTKEQMQMSKPALAQSLMKESLSTIQHDCDTIHKLMNELISLAKDLQEQN